MGVDGRTGHLPPFFLAPGCRLRAEHRKTKITDVARDVAKRSVVRPQIVNRPLSALVAKHKHDMNTVGAPAGLMDFAWHLELLEPWISVGWETNHARGH